jgi:hypothetical protein
MNNEGRYHIIDSGTDTPRFTVSVHGDTYGFSLTGVGKDKWDCMARVVTDQLYDAYRVGHKAGYKAGYDAKTAVIREALGL